MDRRTFLGSIALGAFAPALAGHAQETDRIRRIGFLREYLNPIPPDLVQTLRDLGWVDGRNIRIESRGSEQMAQLPKLAADLVRQRCVVIIAAGSVAAKAVKQATADIPIVFAVGGDPVARGLVDNMAHPGGNLTGFALGIYDEKQLEILKSALPPITRVAYPTIPASSPSDWVKLDAASLLGVAILHIGVETLDDFAPFFTAARQGGAEAALVPDIPRLNPHLKRIGMEASKQGMPAIGYRREFAEEGGLLSYGPVLSEMNVRVALQIDKILRGAHPGDLPVERPTRFELVINLREAKALGVSIPRLVRLRADELIQ